MAPAYFLSFLLLTAAGSPDDAAPKSDAAPVAERNDAAEVGAPQAAVAAPAEVRAPAGNGHPLGAAIAEPHYKADLGLDVGADTFLFKRGQTAFALELVPRVSVLLNAFFDAGFYAAAGYGGPIPEWSQITTFGIGPFVNLSLPLRRNVTFSPWLGVMYHYAFIEGFTGATFAQRNLALPQQSVRIDLHGDMSFAVSKFTALNAGLFIKSRLAPISEGAGTAAQLSYGLRLSATTSF